MSRQSKARHIAAAIHRHVNSKRDEHDLSELRGNTDLAQTAESYARQMAQRGRVGHYINGTTPQDRAPRFVGVSENCLEARNANRSASAIAAEATGRWMHSEGHRENITWEKTSHSGVGVWISHNDVYVVQMFAFRRGVTQTAVEIARSVA